MQQATGFPGVRRRVREAAQTQARIIGAVIMRDMRTRFGRSYLSFGLALAWPLVHIMVIFTAFVAMSRVVPMGASAGRFIATGAMPYILVLYPARMMTLAVLQNHQTLMFPIVKTTDLIIARAIVEFFSAFIVVICFAMIMTALDVDIVPLDWIQAAAAILAGVAVEIDVGQAGAIG